MDLFDAARYAVYLHGLAGDVAKMKYGENSMTARNIAECIADAFAVLEKY
jgi:NAD(P)H-hydrate epimerase